ncbi:synaptogenesis protein syg-2-like [Mytilus edulis]|uniref:synaptogenesis protein syg-2-like n=1 Tax=Mytilus edulis TaxID=6550 RepID=UPI0039EE18F4
MLGVIEGDALSFVCATDSCRPAAWIQWYIGEKNVTEQAQPQTPQQDSDKFNSSSRLVYIGNDEDHNKTIYCEAVNIEGREKVKSKETSIYIQIPLTIVTITPAGINNSAKVVVGDKRTFSCSTGLSRPAAWIQWYIGGENVTNQAQPYVPIRNGDKFISSSRMMYTGKDGDHNNNIYCEAVNIEERDKVKSIAITLYIELPPTALTITPLADNNIVSIMKGETETLNCTTNSCRPAARIHWYIGTLNRTTHAQQQTQQLDGDKFVSSSRIVYQGKDADHNKTIYCEAVTVEGKYKVKSRKLFIYIFIRILKRHYFIVKLRIEKHNGY